MNQPNPIKHTQQTISPMAHFDIDEIVRGRRLGSGGFSHVDAIRGFLPKEDRNDRLDMKDHETRERFANNATNESGVPRFAIKTIQPTMMNDENDFRRAAGDLSNEADILRQLEHPHIIKLRGYPADGVRAYVRTERYDGYFLILDRLDEDLVDRIEYWKRETKRLKNPIFVLKQGRRKQEQLLLERLAIARDIASALNYLHSRRVIYRDLKSDNIGFQATGVTLFDFGLSRPLPKGSHDLTGSYQMSGKVGTIMYMAPEVYERKPYNTKADVYSFSLLLWEMLALQRPFARIHTRKMYKTRVVKNGERPAVDSSWPMEIRILLRKAWSPDMNERPTMSEVHTVLETLVNKMSGKSADQRRVDKQKSIVLHSLVPSAA